MTDKKVTGIECRHAVLCYSNNRGSDLHVVKEVVHYDDGTTEPNVRLVKDYIHL